ncbi:MAG: ABC transporter ATP-binding protein [Acidobacteriaceae bacterium]
MMEQVAATDEAAPGRLEATGSRADLIVVRGLRKQYGNLLLFENIDFAVKRGEMLAIVGQSGAGKSTLLHVLGALDGASAGEVYFEAILLRSLTPVEAADFRNREIGYVWQFHYLLPEFTAAENVALPLLARGKSKKEALREARQWLDEVGLADRSTHRSGELSGGEQQRVSIARALITTPKLLLADEPTGDLDDQTADSLFALIKRLHASYGLTSVLVTHNLALARRCDRVLRLAHGRIEEVVPQEV